MPIEISLCFYVNGIFGTSGGNSLKIKRLRDLAVSAGKGGKRGKNRPLMASVEKQEQQTSPGHHLLSLLKAIAELITGKTKCLLG